MHEGAMTLDHDQMAAVQADPRAPLLILAGPGSGKTLLLVERIALLQAYQQSGGVPPRSIVALTFTRNAARELASRLRTRLEDQEMGQVQIRTFHGFGLHLLRNGWAREYLGLDRFRVATTGQTRQAATHAITSEGLDIPPRVALQAIADEKLGRTTRPMGRGHVRAVRLAYDAWLRAHQLIDMHDMIVLPIEILRIHPTARADLQRRVAHVIGDESQDWNRYQAALIAYAGGPRGHITAVGDAKQSIFSGSSPRYLLEFPLVFAQTQVLHLTRTYRLHAALLAVATAVAAQIDGAIVTGVPDRDDGPLPTLHIARSLAAEGVWIGRELRALHASGMLQRWSDAVVLVRTRAQRRRVQGALRAAGLPCRVHAPTLASAPAIAAIMAWLALLRDGNDTTAIVAACTATSPGRRREEAHALRAALSRNGPWTMERLYRECPPGLSDRQRRDLAAFVHLHGGLAHLAAGDEPTIIFDAVLERTGLRDEFDGANDHVRAEITALRALVAQEGDVGALQHLLSEDVGEGSGDTIRVSTVHGFKGNQAEVVFVAGLDEGVFPHRLCIDAGPEGLQQELRAFYVALTRSRTLLYLSASCEPSMSGTEGRPSPFLDLIPPHLLRSA